MSVRVQPLSDKIWRCAGECQQVARLLGQPHERFKAQFGAAARYRYRKRLARDLRWIAGLAKRAARVIERLEET